MARLRRRFSLARLMVAVLILAVNFAWLSRMHWPFGVVFSAGLAFSGGLIVPLFVAGLSLTEMGLIISIAWVVGGLLLPSVTPDHSRRRRAAPPPAATGPGPGSGMPPGEPHLLPTSLCPDPRRLSEPHAPPATPPVDASDRCGGRGDGVGYPTVDGGVISPVDLARDKAGYQVEPLAVLPIDVLRRGQTGRATRASAIEWGEPV